MTSAAPSPSLVRGAAYLATLAGRRVVVVGLARSGIAAARLLRGAGAHVIAVDAKPIDALSADARALAGTGVVLMSGGADDDVARALAGADLVVVSPGVPLDGPQLAPARAARVPIVGELELGWRATDADAVAITGTNGKTTTTALTGALLAAQPRPVTVAGNIGTPLCALAPDVAPGSLVVLEASSFQLETIEHFHPRVAAILNITPDHLDRHRTLAAYAAAKARILENQGPGDCAVLNADDEGACRLADAVRGELVWFSRRRALDRGVFVREGRMVARLDAHEEDIAPLADITLRGQHNVENVLAATACALWVGLTPAPIRQGIAAFRAVEHRIEFVRELAGAAYYNDSKGTNVESTIRAIESFAEPILLIAGGKGKGQDFAPLAAAARGRVKRAFLIGEDAPAIAGALEAATVPVTRSASLAAALDGARAAAARGDVVLLSPACASFDMFDSYEHRGQVFKGLVAGLR